jgi:hypothetical protein
MCHDNGDRAGGLLCRTPRLRPRSDEDIHLAVDELSRKLVEPLVLPLHPAVLYGAVLPLHIAVRTQGTGEGRKERPGRVSKVSYPGHLAGRLRGGDQRRCEEAEDDDEPDSRASHGQSFRG